MTPHIISSIADGVMQIEIARAERRNALTVDMYQALARALDAADRDEAVGVMLIQGSAAVFTAGNDIEDFLARPPSGLDAPVFDFLRALLRARKPLVAAVSGPAVGIGTTLLLHCDQVVAGQSARFALPFVNLGLCPEAASSLLLPRAIGPARANEMLLSGRSLDAGTALAWGLVQQVVPDAEVLAAGRALALSLAAKPRAALLATKALLRQPVLAAAEAALAEEALRFGALLRSAESREALAAFLEKRAPDFARARAAA
jgi:enoyl-CoA hydratase/carnithine racemase